MAKLLLIFLSKFQIRRLKVIDFCSLRSLGCVLYEIKNRKMMFKNIENIKEWKGVNSNGETAENEIYEWIYKQFKKLKKPSEKNT